MNINRRLPFTCKSGTITSTFDVVGQIIPDNIDEGLIDHVLVLSNQGIVASSQLWESLRPSDYVDDHPAIVSDKVQIELFGVRVTYEIYVALNFGLTEDDQAKIKTAIHALLMPTIAHLTAHLAMDAARDSAMLLVDDKSSGLLGTLFGIVDPDTDPTSPIFVDMAGVVPPRMRAPRPTQPVRDS